ARPDPLVETGAKASFSTLSAALESGDMFTFSTLPTAIGDEFEVTIDVTLLPAGATDFSDPQGTFQATIKAKVIEPVSNTAEPPSCDDTEYAKPIYKS